MKKLLVLALLSIVALSGCSYFNPGGSEETPTTTSMEEVTTPSVSTPDKEISVVVPIQEDLRPNLVAIGNPYIWVGSDEGGIPYPVGFGSYYPGSEADELLFIYNTYPYDIQVDLGVSVDLPIPPVEGEAITIKERTFVINYMPGPSIVKDWVTLSEVSLVIPANSRKDIEIALKVPKGTDWLDKRWEFRVTVLARGQGFVEIKYGQRWMITMR